MSRHRLGARRAAPALLAGALCLAARADQAALLPSLVIGFSDAVLSEVDLKDAKAATKVWADMIMRRKHVKVESDGVVFDGLASMDDALRAGRVDLVWLLPRDYLEARGRLPIVPIVIASPGSVLFNEFVLVVRRGGGIGSLRDLKDRRLVVETNRSEAVSRVWLETLLMKEGWREEPQQFFASVKAARKPSQIVMPVFFGQADAGVVTRHSFDTMVELNPQLGRELKSIASSAPYVAAIGCLRREYNDKYGESIRETLERLHEDPQGKQILALFRQGKLVRFTESHLASVESLLKEHDALRLQLAGRPSP